MNKSVIESMIKSNRLKKVKDSRFLCGASFTSDLKIQLYDTLKKVLFGSVGRNNSNLKKSGYIILLLKNKIPSLF